MKFTQFRKFDDEQKLVYGAVFSPMVPDSQSDWMTAEDIEKMAHSFNESGKSTAIDINHDLKASGCKVAESFIARTGDKDFSAGTWALGVRCTDPVWAMVKSGKLTGFSMYGSGRRIEKALPGNPKGRYQLTDGEIEAVSLVSRPANRQEFRIMKGDNVADVLKGIADSIEKMGDSMTSLTQRLDDNDKRLNALKTDAEGRVVKAVQQDPDVTRLLRKRTRLNERLSAIWDRPDMFEPEAEREVCKSLQRVEDDLHSYGYQERATGLDSNSAFFRRGGSSSFISGGGSSLDDILGVSRNTRSVQKQADEAVENTLTFGGSYGGDI